MKLWKWLGRNVTAFQALGQGLTALTVLGAALLAIGGFFWKSSTPDLLLSSQRYASTIPADLIKWSKAVADALQYLPEQSANEPHFLDRLRPLAASDTAKRVPILYYSGGLDQLALSVTNQAKHAVSGTRLRVTGQKERLWDVYVQGTFLTEEEAEVFAQKIKAVSGAGKSALILPELPTLPPQNSLTIALVGSFAPDSEVTVVVPADNFAVLDYVELRRSWLINMYLNPRESFVPAMVLLVIFIGLGVEVWQRSKRKTLYNAACRVALEGHYSPAMHLLEKAFEAGYSNREQVKCDPDLEPLRTREDFKKLIGDPPESTP